MHLLDLLSATPKALTTSRWFSENHPKDKRRAIDLVSFHLERLMIRIFPSDGASFMNAGNETKCNGFDLLVKSMFDENGRSTFDAWNLVRTSDTIYAVGGY